MLAKVSDNLIDIDGTRREVVTINACYTKIYWNTIIMMSSGSKFSN